MEQCLNLVKLVDFNGKEIEIWTGRDIDFINYTNNHINLTMDNNLSYDNLKNEFLNKVVIKNGQNFLSRWIR